MNQLAVEPGSLRQTLMGLVLAVVTVLTLTLGDGAIAATAPAASLTIHLGTADGELRFEPDQMQFVVGQRYKLVLDNPSSEKHYFTAKDFADGIWTQKVQAAGVEVKGAIHELELKPGAIAEWVFVPQRPGLYELHCAIAGHAAAGMVGQLEIVASGS
ncbi:biphenyl 2,3-dioxygenase [Nodosilinea sp. LEGE 06152]|uniref:biphenyl 2,3-dioxygenase n=1 Tax=Nodosilinea sp. LEGE 06152 TaxID=2777966 RepID=UPI00187F8504|nr:biphenyl 2,3-dioxygenase [Nodosilinea sp. LEGE 06152]MBE9158604.1 biphenyl 2,3-dioxygenase [Nodosilinea sp. LEGE 06152]